MSLLYSIQQLEEKAKHDTWNCIYLAVDIHGTILVPTYTSELSSVFYPKAEKYLRLLSSHDSIKIILFSGTSDDKLQKYKEFFEAHGIRIFGLNNNPDIAGVRSTINKPFFSLLLDDKAGFNPYLDWEPLYYYLMPLIFTLGGR